MELAQHIGRKWVDFTKNTNGNSIRFKDGNPHNDSSDNMEEVSANRRYASCFRLDC